MNAERPTSNSEDERDGCEAPPFDVDVRRSTFDPLLSSREFLHAPAQLRSGDASCASLLDELGFVFAPRPYTLFFAQKEKLSAAVYEKGPKLLLQGKGIEEFVQFELEPKILGEAKLGYEEVHSPEMFEPHFGVDESGKGDFFGPLVIAGVYVDRGIARKFMEAGIQDSKRIGSDARIHALADVIRKTQGAIADTVVIGPGAVQRSLREVWQPQQPARLGPRARDRELARETAGLSARLIGQVC
ncbi:MAG: hypothetical protein WKF47_06665 [Geodermatophilaceae bacterium]